MLTKDTQKTICPLLRKIRNHKITMETTDITEIDEDTCQSTRVRIDDNLNTEKNMVSILTGSFQDSPRKVLKSIKDGIAYPKLTVAIKRKSKSAQNLAYTCKQCTESFTTSNKFKAHCISKHGITHPYKCDHCENVYTHKGAMKVHLRTHSNDRPFTCEECGRSFSQSSTLAGHMMRHSGATPHICEVCGKAFVLKGDLRTHCRIHLPTKPYHCYECGLSFPRKSNFTRHMRKHTGEKPYECLFCSKRFARSENRTEHQRTHTNERPYVCKICDARFSDSGNFSKHKRLHITNKLSKKICSNSKNVRREAEDILEVNESMQVNKPVNSKRKNNTKPRKIKKERPISPEAQPLTISLVRQPTSLDDVTKQNTIKETAEVGFTHVLVPLPEPMKSNTNGFIKIPADILSNSKELTVPVDDGSKMSSTTFNYQYPGLFNTQSITNSIPELDYSNSQAFMMLDYYNRDSSFSFSNDGNLILQGSSFSRSHGDDLTGSDSYMYGTSLVPHEQDSMHNSLFTRAESGGTSLASTSNFALGNSSDERDKHVSQPLDTSKFLNEQYLMKKEQK